MREDIECPHCNRRNSFHRIYCSWCGKKMDESDELATSNLQTNRRSLNSETPTSGNDESREIIMPIRITVSIAIFFIFVLINTIYFPSLSMRALVGWKSLAWLLIITLFATMALIGFLLFTDDWRIRKMNSAMKTIFAILLIIFLSMPFIFTAIEISYINSEFSSHDPISINGNGDFTPENGVIYGNGSDADPYILERWNIYALENTGIAISNTDVHFIIRNVQVHNGGLSNDGILLDNVSNGNIVGCRFMDNFFGVFLENCRDILIYHNDFIDNIASAGNLNGFDNEWDNGYPSGGNYWSGHMSEDRLNGPAQNILGSDGIADKPFLVNFFGSIDEYPLMKEYTKSATPPAFLLIGIAIAVMMMVIYVIIRLS